MSTAAPRMPPSQAEPALVQSITALLQQLVAGLERLKLACSPRAVATSDLARISTRLQQLRQWLPAGNRLQLQLVKLHKLLPALLQPQPIEVTVRLLAAIYEIQQTQLVAVPVDLREGRNITAWSALTPLTQLWRGQQQTADIEADSLIQPLLAMLLQQLVAVAYRPSPSPQQVGELLQRMQAVLEFGGSPAQQRVFSELAQTVSLVVLHPQLFSPGQQVQSWRTLWRFVQQRQLPATCVAVCHDLELLQTMQLELDRYRWQLQMFLQNAAVKSVTEPVLVAWPVLLLLYRLPWILAAVEQHSLAQLCQLWYQNLMVHWQHRLPLTKDLLPLWCDLSVVLDLSRWADLTERQISRWHLQLLQQWPCAPTHQVEYVALPGVREGGDAPVPLAGIPELLSRSFGMLAEQVSAAWFADAPAYQLHVGALVAELQLLEQAAAAIKLSAIESFCSLLLALHHHMWRALPEIFPGALLWRAHQHLRDLLDETAAWQQSVPDVQLIADMRAWLVPAPHALPPPASAEAPAAAMMERVQFFVDSLARSVEQPLRFSVELAENLPLSSLSVCEEALIALLRLLVLEQVQNMQLRRQALKPLATSLMLKLAAGEDGIAVEITEAGIETPPDAKTLKRLRHKLPAAVQRLYCRTQPGRGRSFHLVI